MLGIRRRSEVVLDNDGSTTPDRQTGIALVDSDIMSSLAWSHGPCILRIEITYGFIISPALLRWVSGVQIDFKSYSHEEVPQFSRFSTSILALRARFLVPRV